MNTISLIRPYKHHGQWVFDDPRVGLDKEPFIAGADTLIDLAIAHLKIPNADTGFLLLFSAARSTLRALGVFPSCPLC